VQFSREVAVVGAGPHGLAVASYLRSGRADAAFVGHPMSLCSEHMPADMPLPSPRPTFGPLMRLGAGSKYAAATVAHRAAGRAAAAPPAPPAPARESPASI
jgi:hypothetical protein